MCRRRRLDAIGLCTAADMLQAPINNMPYLSASEESLLSYSSSNDYFFAESGNNGAFGEVDQDMCQLSGSKSVESLNTLLSNLPDIVIPEPVYNPLPLQCLAATSLPDSVRSDIDNILHEFSVTVKSPSHILQQDSSGASGPASMNAMKDMASRKEDARSSSKELQKGSECRENGRNEVGRRNEGQDTVDSDKVQCTETISGVLALFIH